MRRLPQIVLLVSSLSSCMMVKQNATLPLPLLGGPDRLTDAVQQPQNYAQFFSKTRKIAAVSDVEKARAGVLKEAAISYAAQAGYERRIYEITQALEKKSDRLSDEFNFNAIVYRAPQDAGYILPPVVTRAKAAMTIGKGGRESIAADEYYRIERPGHIVGVIPSWRDYLLLPLDQPQEPDVQFLPDGRAERALWDRFLAEGWSEGTQQADTALQINLNLLQRDYLGMIEYRRLVQAGLIKTLAVTSSAKRAAASSHELYLGQRRIRIENDAEFAVHNRRWNPIGSTNKHRARP